MLKSPESGTRETADRKQTGQQAPKEHPGNKQATPTRNQQVTQVRKGTTEPKKQGTQRAEERPLKEPEREPKKPSPPGHHSGGGNRPHTPPEAAASHTSRTTGEGLPEPQVRCAEWPWNICRLGDHRRRASRTAGQVRGSAVADLKRLGVHRRRASPSAGQTSGMAVAGLSGGCGEVGVGGVSAGGWRVVPFVVVVGG